MDLARSHVGMRQARIDRLLLIYFLVANSHARSIGAAARQRLSPIRFFQFSIALYVYVSVYLYTPLWLSTVAIVVIHHDSSALRLRLPQRLRTLFRLQ